MTTGTRWSAAAFLFVHSFAVAACTAATDPDAPPRRPRGVLQGPPAATPEPPRAATPPTETPPPPPPPRPAPPAAPAAALAEEPAPRDYGTELLQALGDPIQCLAPRKGTEAPSKLQIDFDAYVMPSGGVGRAYARSADLDASERDCLRRRVEAVRLTPPIEDAPREVHASIQLTLKAAESQSK